MLDGREILADVEPAVTALAVAGNKPALQVGPLCVAPGPPPELRSVHATIIVPKDAIFKAFWITCQFHPIRRPEKPSKAVSDPKPRSWHGADSAG